MSQHTDPEPYVSEERQYNEDHDDSMHMGDDDTQNSQATFKESAQYGSSNNPSFQQSFREEHDSDWERTPPPTRRVPPITLQGPSYQQAQVGSYWDMKGHYAAVINCHKEKDGTSEALPITIRVYHICSVLIREFLHWQRRANSSRKQAALSRHDVSKVEHSKKRNAKFIIRPMSSSGTSLQSSMEKLRRRKEKFCWQSWRRRNHSYVTSSSAALQVQEYTQGMFSITSNSDAEM
jgi:hypothetical protein